MRIVNYTSRIALTLCSMLLVLGLSTGCTADTRVPLPKEGDVFVLVHLASGSNAVEIHPSSSSRGYEVTDVSGATVTLTMGRYKKVVDWTQVASTTQR